MKLLAAMTFSLLLPFSFIYGGIAGTYQARGVYVDGTPYTGTLVIEKTGNIYHAEWTLSNGSSTGIGVKKGDYLAFNFVGDDSVDNPIAGVQLYQIRKNVLEGPFAINGEATRGFERSRKQR